MTYWEFMNLTDEWAERIDMGSPNSQDILILFGCIGVGLVIFSVIVLIVMNTE